MTARPLVQPRALDRARDLVRPSLLSAVERLTGELQAPVQHHLGGGGKHVRAALSLLAAEACGADAETGVPGAVAIELIHNFSLLHDDVIDGDRERRHRPTVWAEFGVGPAIISGDALATLAMEVLLEAPNPHAPRAALELARATQAMIAGQADDMAYEPRAVVGLEECLAMEERKTGALLSCAVALGAILAGASDATVQALREYGRHLGIAFQAVDDLLGIWGDPAVTGKPVGSDLRQHKKTLPIVIAVAAADGLAGEFVALLRGRLSEREVATAAQFVEGYGGRDATMRMAEEHLAAALGALDAAPLEAGAAAELADVAMFVVGRDR
ncbi:MAG TPA: polyprenyl synthetase family protein [Acidimicrobiales bacterium]|nr:polyprenyl synthetase family protein [Acidimicrobiales bacterium]